MKKYILNSAVLTAFGQYEYRAITIEEARRWYDNTVISTVGYTETAEVLSQLLGISIPVNRITIKMEQGDEALVFRLVLPPGHPRIDPKNKGHIYGVITSGYWELGLLRRIA